MKKKTLFVIADTEASGPVPGLFDMISVGLVVLNPELDQKFYAEFAPLHSSYKDDAYKSIGVTRQQHLDMPDAETGTRAMAAWLDSLEADQIKMISDNPAFDFPMVSWYLHRYVGHNPFGWSAHRFGDFAAGLERYFWAKQIWKRRGKTKHSHNALDDATRVAEAILATFRLENLKPIW